MAIPATGLGMATPASCRAMIPPQTVAIDEDPLDSRMSETIRIVYGNSSSEGSTGKMARSANTP